MKTGWDNKLEWIKQNNNNEFKIKGKQFKYFYKSTGENKYNSNPEKIYNVIYSPDNINNLFVEDEKLSSSVKGGMNIKNFVLMWMLLYNLSSKNQVE